MYTGSTSPEDEPCSNTRGIPCDSDCLCKLISKDYNIISESDSQDSTLDVEEIYQVLGRDILKSSLLDDIELYLECEEDNSYHVPPTGHSGERKFILPQLPPGSKSRFKVTFPCPPPIEELPRYLCEYCSKSFTKETLLKNHQAREHDVHDLFQCTYCSYKGLLNSHLRKHMKRKHLPQFTEKEPKCGLGKKSNDLKKSYKANVMTRETNKQKSDQLNSVQTCTPLEINQVSSYVQSESNHASKPKDDFTDTDNIIDHTMAKPESDCFVEILQMSPTTQLEKGWLLDCRQCRKSFKSVSAFNEHTKQVHGPKLFLCPYEECKKAFSAKRRLKAHIVSHTSTFTCTWPKCGNTFRDQYNLEIHRKSHEGKKDIKCSLCDYVCIQRNSLKWHMSKKHSYD